MPTLNQARFIAESVASVMSQGIEGLELVVADGGSSDGTLEVLAALAAQYPGAVHWASARDGGPAQAVNAAVDRARGAVIGWLNSDDLYTPGAVQRALTHFESQPDHVMVYGHAEHVGEHGETLAPYPTRPPDVPLSAWADGCPICQPTAFFRREAFVELGGLDTGLRTAFDYDFWFRLFLRFPGRIGFLPQVQARSRLHAAGITLRLREHVTMESMEVVHRHLGAAPGHWLVTHVAEALARCPFEAEPTVVQAHLLGLAERAAPWLGPGGVDELKRQMQASRAWQLTRPHFATNVHGDGWAGPEFELRLRQPETLGQRVGRLVLTGRHAWPRPGRLRLQLTVWHGGRQVAAASAWWRQRFVLHIPVTERQPSEHLVFVVRASDAFVPAELVPGARDGRRLAFMVESVELLPVA